VLGFYIILASFFVDEERKKIINTCKQIVQYTHIRPSCN